MSANPTAGIVIVEDDPAVRQYFLTIINREAGYDIIGIAPASFVADDDKLKPREAELL